MRNAMSAPISNTAATFRAVAVLGASPNPERYSNMAIVLIKAMHTRHAEDRPVQIL